MSSMSLSVSAPADRPPPCRLMPLLLPSSPPTSTRVLMRGPSIESTCRLICPSLSSSTSPDETSDGSFLYAIPTAWSVPASTGSEASSVNSAPSASTTLPDGESVDADLRTLQVAEHTHVAAGLARRFPHQLQAPRVIGERAVREIDPHHIDAGTHHVGKHLGVVRGGTERRDDFGPTQNEAHAARCSRISTAGSFLPSTNSRNAPPPVEM